MTLTEAAILAVIEGLTEFLPISSTGHMIIGSSVMGIQHEQFTKLFTVLIQFGAILSVVVLYWKRFFQTVDFYLKLFVAFLPAAIIGFLLHDKIDALLENPMVDAISLLAGGIILLFVDNIFSANKNEPEKPVTFLNAIRIGIFQCVAMIPGVSRSAATIIGGMAGKLNRKQAAEFSFFLAVPTMFAASAYQLLKEYKSITSENITPLIAGNVIAFLVALLAIRFFIGFLQKYGFKIFGWYRILLGGTILILLAMHYDLKSF